MKQSQIKSQIMSASIGLLLRTLVMGARAASVRVGLLLALGPGAFPHPSVRHKKKCGVPGD